MEPLEEYHSPFDFEQGVNASYLYLSPAYGDTPPSSPAVATRAAPPNLQECLYKRCRDDGRPVRFPPAMTEEERQELQEELLKVEDEIQTLSQVLAAKEKQAADIKRKLGITPLNELKQNLTRTWQDVTASTAYRRTSETLSQASLKATTAFSNMGSVLSRKLEDVRCRDDGRPVRFPPAMTEEERQELQEELLKVEDEIQTLSQVLAAKEKQAADIKRKLGITPLNELKQNLTRTWQDVTASTAYRRTSETLSQASLKATTAFSNMGSVLSRKLEDVRSALTSSSGEGGQGGAGGGGGGQEEQKLFKPRVYLENKEKSEGANHGG
ncbi:Tumor protein D52 [Takifugu flavidus]|uniref:Tumor protein D52 n=1 Tax=Takifugu flavidus TaxID=433684 RepID=A0A5C6NF73_9TELE|nr:Tumor protein D52 [Takifugu flavidus]